MELIFANGVISIVLKTPINLFQKIIEKWVKILTSSLQKKYEWPTNT